MRVVLLVDIWHKDLKEKEIDVIKRLLPATQETN